MIEMSNLQESLADGPVENGALVVQRLALLSNTLLTRAESAEILHRLRDHLAIETHDYAPCHTAIKICCLQTVWC